MPYPVLHDLLILPPSWCPTPLFTKIQPRPTPGLLQPPGLFLTGCTRRLYHVSLCPGVCFLWGLLLQMLAETLPPERVSHLMLLSARTPQPCWLFPPAECKPQEQEPCPPCSWPSAQLSAGHTRVPARANLNTCLPLHTIQSLYTTLHHLWYHPSPVHPSHTCLSSPFPAYCLHPATQSSLNTLGTLIFICHFFCSEHCSSDSQMAPSLTSSRSLLRSPLLMSLP